jgi:hypothetical protein
MKLNEAFAGSVGAQDADTLIEAILPSTTPSIIFWGLFVWIGLNIAASIDESKPENKVKQSIILGVVISTVMLYSGIKLMLNNIVLYGSVYLIVALFVLFLSIKNIKTLKKNNKNT